MPIQLQLSPRIIPSIATAYTDINRVFMEYIDNSIDSAEDLYDHASNSYKRAIKIELNVIDL